MSLEDRERFFSLRGGEGRSDPRELIEALEVNKLNTYLKEYKGSKKP